MAKLLSETYEVKKTVGRESITIFVVIDSDDQVTIQTHDKKPQFTFTRSNKDRVAALAEAFKEAADIVEQRKVHAA